MNEYRGNFIANTWTAPTSPDGHLVRENPCRKSETIYEFGWDVASVDRAVAAARKALSGWDRLGLDARMPYLQRFRQALANRAEAMARAIALETGKPLWEARTEVSGLTAKIDIMAGEGLQYTADVYPEGLDGGSFRARPLGVVAVLGPFNFPLHLANGHIIPALLSGNTVVVKPSELTASSMQLYFECIEEADFPAGVINLVHGPGPVGAALAGHPSINAVLFTGSYETGLRIQQATLHQHWKLLALEMGGKNTSIVLEDADLAQAAHEILMASCLTTGQRCSATSRIVLHEQIADAFTERFVELVSRVTTGDAFADDAFMGPLVNKAAFDKFIGAQQLTENANLTPLLEGGPARPDLDGYFVKPAIWRAHKVDPSGAHQSCEIFGPDIIIYHASNDDHAAHIANATEYGLAMSVFTADETRFDNLAYELQTGILNMNRSTVGASSRLPFGGVKKSGNHRPSAILAGQYCTFPQSQLRQRAGWTDDQLQKPPLSLLLGKF
ncbi:MAG: aldehyde dehydrogenase family protein [Bradymonadaceae bacterium]|nr:aldehyde dehydrogenase family protein [Lujinxingiaceae bacterium]